MPMTEKMRVRLNELVEASTMSVPKIAKAAEMPHPDLYRLLSGKKADIESGTLERLAGALGCTVELLNV